MQRPHRGRVTTFQRLISTILLLKLFRKTNLVILEAVNTTSALILTTQKHTEIYVCRNLFSPPLCNLHSLFLLFPYLFCTHIILFSILGAILYKYSTSTKTLTHNQTKYNTTVLRKKNARRINTERLLDWSQPISHQCCRHTEFLKGQYEDVVLDDDAVRATSQGQKQAHQRKLMIGHRSQSSLLYRTSLYSLYSLYFFQNHEKFRNFNDCKLSVAPCHRSFLETLNTLQMNQGLWRNFSLNR